LRLASPGKQGDTPGPAVNLNYLGKRKVFDQTLYQAIISAPSDAGPLERAKTLVAQAVANKIVDPAEADTLPGDDTRPWERRVWPCGVADPGDDCQ
jgi:hypothetical protein